jgi:hypothetical protein
LGTWVLRNPEHGREGQFDQAEAGASDDPELVTDTDIDVRPDDAEAAPAEFGSIPIDTRAQVEQPAAPDDLTIPDDPSDDGSIPPCLRRCEQCGGPSDPDKGAVTPRDFGGIQHWLHDGCDFEF